MTTSKNSGGNKTTPGAASTPTASGDTDLVIPTMGANPQQVLTGAQGGPVIQDGEDAGAVGQNVNPNEPAMSAHGGEFGRSLTGGVQALHRPVIRQGGDDVFENTPGTGRSEFTMAALDKALEDMKRTDQRIEPVNTGLNFDDHAAALAFNEEPVIINIHETTEVGAENPVPISNNGVTVLIHRGVPTVVRRKYVEQLMRMKPQVVSTRIDRSDVDNIKNIIEKRSALKNPFTVVRDDNPLSRRWITKVMSEH